LKRQVKFEKLRLQ